MHWKMIQIRLIIFSSTPVSDQYLTETMIGAWGIKPGNLNGSCVRDAVAGALEFDLSSGAVPLGLGLDFLRE